MPRIRQLLLPAFAGSVLPAGPPPLVISWGLGGESSAITTRLLLDPEGFGVDLRRVILIHAVTGDEWDNTVQDATRFIVPLIRKKGVRLIQVARGGPLDSDGVEILDDSRSPHPHLPAWQVAPDELRRSGTVPMIAKGKRLCSIKYKGSVIDRLIASLLGGQPYRHVLGFNSEEGARVLRDQTYTSMTRNPEYPLITWDWNCEACLAYLRQQFGITWSKSYCAQCPFPANIAGLGQHLQRLRAFPERAGQVLRMEHVALALNPNSPLFGTTPCTATSWPTTTPRHWCTSGAHSPPAPGPSTGSAASSGPAATPR